MRSFEKKFLVILLAFFFVIHSPVFAKKSKTHLFFEKEYQNYWCATQGGVTEYVLSDKTRVDCVTDKYAIEFDFANKWAESIGQSLYYGKMLNKIPAIVLIVEDKTRDAKFIRRVKMLADEYGIYLTFITPEDLSRK